LFLNTPKLLFISGPKPKQDQIKEGWYQEYLAVFSKVNNQKWLKILQKSLIFMHPESTQIFIDYQKVGIRKETVENHPKSSIITN
jgi:hypothetical protein